MDKGVLRMTEVQEKQQFSGVERKQMPGLEQVPDLSATSQIIHGEDEMLEKKMDQLLQRIAQLERQLQEINGLQKVSTLTNPLTKQSIDTVRHYVNMGKMAGYIIETVAAGAMTIIDSISSASKDKTPCKTPVKNIATPDSEVDISGIIQSVGALIKGLNVSVNANEITPPNPKSK